MLAIVHDLDHPRSIIAGMARHMVYAIIFREDLVRVGSIRDGEKLMDPYLVLLTVEPRFPPFISHGSIVRCPLDAAGFRYSLAFVSSVDVVLFHSTQNRAIINPEFISDIR